VFLNADEARGLTGLEPEKAVHAIFDRAGVRTVVVKLGAKGSLVLEAGVLHQIGIRPVKAVDTTGAGDAYAAGFLYGVAKGWDPVSCARLAASVAGLAVAQIGAVVKDREALAAVIREVEAERVTEVAARVGA
jgi:sugar/nucleoside kinase (ribokinase family)